jgi:Glycosyltransferase like family 2
LNRGIETSRGRYIARQDQDDLALPGRFAKQLAFLNENPDVAIVGTWAHIYAGDTPTARYHRHPCSNVALQLELLFNNSFVHSSVMIRAAVLREVGGYCEDKSLQPPEDYELWSRIARRYPVANLPEVLTVYREVPGSMSRAMDNPFLKNLLRISSENLHQVLAPRYESKDCRLLAELYHGGGIQGSSSHLSIARARQMLDFAAQKIGGEQAAWSDEFLASYQRIRAHLDSRFWQRKIPAALVGPARWIRNRLVALTD